MKTANAALLSEGGVRGDSSLSARQSIAVGSLAALFTLFAFVRLIALDADPPPSLSWSAGIFSDEGIYSLDARSVLLTGHWASGNFHSAVVAPLLHLIQIGVFEVFGLGLIQARLVSVVFSLATLALFYAALRRLYSDHMALMAVTLLGLSFPFVCYNRLALLETPTLFWLMLAFFIWAHSGSRLLVGVVLGIAVVFKPLALLIVPAFVLGVWPDRRGLLLLTAGLGGALAIYAVAWYLPHEAALSRMNHYYAFHQYLPHSWVGLWHNFARGLWTGENDGVLPYLFSHAAFFLFLAGMAFWFADWKDKADRLLFVWLMTPITVFLFLSYTPSRYFVLFWPALAALAAWRLSTAPLKYGWAFTGCIIAISLFQLAGAWHERTYTLRDQGRRLAQVLPPGTLVAGQFAPELGLSNRLPVLYVQPGLANDQQLLPATVTAVLVTRSPYWNDWWKDKAPNPVIGAPRQTFKIGPNYTVDMYLQK